MVFIGLLALFNSVFDSTLASGGIRFISSGLAVNDKSQLVLLTSVYLTGYVTGPLAFGPMSEIYGRRMVLIPTFALFTIFTLACAVAPNWPALLIFRALCGVCASSSITVTGGLFSDVYRSPRARGRTMALSMAVGGGLIPACMISNSYLDNHCRSAVCAARLWVRRSH